MIKFKKSVIADYTVQQQKCFLLESRNFIFHLGYKILIYTLQWLVSVSYTHLDVYKRQSTIQGRMQII